MKNTKALVKEHTNDFRGILRAFADKVKGKLPKSQLGRLRDAEEHQESENQYRDEEIQRQSAAKKKNKSKSRDMEL